mgnify:CR=1 FL=1
MTYAPPRRRRAAAPPRRRRRVGGQYNMRLIDGALSDAMSGFEHNAVTPLGLATPMPIIVHSAIAKLPGGHFWLGGGEVDLKLRFDTAVFLEHFKPVVADVCG